MPSDPSSLKKYCLAKARECRRAAELANDPAQRRRWMEIEADWFFLARSYDNELRASVAGDNSDSTGKELIIHADEAMRPTAAGTARSAPRTRRVARSTFRGKRGRGVKTHK